MQHSPFFQDLQVWLHIAASFTILHIFKEASNLLVIWLMQHILQGDFVWNFEADLGSHNKLILYTNVYGVRYHRL